MTTETIPLTQDQGGARPDGPGSQATPSAAGASSPVGADPSRDMPLVHIRGQFSWHGEALIVGNVAGLIAVRDAIDAALTARTSDAVVFAADGEGYAVTVRRSARVGDMGEPPYVDDMVNRAMATERSFVRDHKRQYRDYWMDKRNEAFLRDSDSRRMAETGTGSVRSTASAGRTASPEDQPIATALKGDRA